MLSKLKISKIFQENLILYTAIISGLFCVILLGERFLLDNFDPLGQHIAPETEWNADRLAMAFFWKYKFHLYNPENSVGPLISDMYGPLLALAYLPATIANTPTVALVLGKLTSLVFYLRGRRNKLKHRLDKLHSPQSLLIILALITINSH